MLALVEFSQLLGMLVGLSGFVYINGANDFFPSDRMNSLWEESQITTSLERKNASLISITIENVTHQNYGRKKKSLHFNLSHVTACSC